MIEQPWRVIFLGVVALGLWTCDASADDVVIADFEGENYGEWGAEGEAFGKGPARGAADMEHFGERVAGSFHNGDPSTGTLTSPEFTVTKPYLAFLIGGGNHPVETGIELLVDGKRVRRATGNDLGILQWKSWDVRELQGRKARLRIFDYTGSAWGHVTIDQIVLTDQPRTGFDQSKLEAYRRSAEYYREPNRPQYHFTPERNWMNDPNGLVYFDGEYHLFYQYNPFGNEWGHMSWGHAVSTDLVHWQHLPVAIYEDQGLMAFSGSAVVDWKNTSGFGQNGQPPLVAIYTAHGRGEQTQHLAYSNDRGRTWQPYEGNPVLDLNSADFRDPRVFWHEPSQRWIMVVSLAVQKRLLFYGSPDLKHWDYLSEFGPAGAPEKPNWECPDLFELAIENEPGKTRWVLEVDLGGGAIAGGSGSEYFLGSFDGQQFIPDGPADQVRWVDYGRDFYAPISFSDIPAEDGRRIWIGWMNNWETNLVPTSPWRGTMSIPRTLSLRRTSEGLRLCQKPVRELQQLRERHMQADDITLNPESPWIPEMQGQQLELVLELEPGSSRECGVRVLVGENEQTTVGYDVAAREMFVDRTNSGQVDFHERFPGRHAGPLPLEDGRIKLHLFVDASTVEVFGNDGRTVISDLVFPSPESQKIEVYAHGGSARVVSLQLWSLKSIWHKGTEK